MKLETVEKFIEQWKVKAKVYYTDLKEMVRDMKNYENYPLSEDVLKSYKKYYWQDRSYKQVYNDEKINEILEMYNKADQTFHEEHEIIDVQKNLASSKFRNWSGMQSQSLLTLLTEMCNEQRMNEIIAKEAEHKKATFYSKINDKKDGDFVKSYLSIGSDSEINGYIEFSNNSISVKTIGAGGYNVQRFHYRTLVKVMK